MSFLVVFGRLDKGVDPDAGFHLIREAKSSNNHLLYYDNLYDDMYHEEMFDGDVLARHIEA